MKKIFLCLHFLLLLLIGHKALSQPLNKKETFTHQDSLRGSIGEGRDWWNVTKYHIFVEPNYQLKEIKGWTEISFLPTKPGKDKIMQIDLQMPLEIEKILFEGNEIKNFAREGNVYWIKFGEVLFNNKKDLPFKLKIFFSGKPVIAKLPPWDGGWIFSKDAQGRPWMTVACQGLGASVWYPCKDHQSDEPDKGAILEMLVPDTLVAVGNGRMISKLSQRENKTLYSWEVKNPINNYNIIPYIGKYVTWHEEYNGEKGKLDCDYWVLDYNLEKAKKQFTQVNGMLQCFEKWLGPYPFYEDGYKLVETPHLGMEHQSAVAYGNQYQNGYLGRDLSGSGWGKDWDFIIIHESGHEWFGNNITTNDIADMWVHEGFTNYTETLFVECRFGKEAGNAYTLGLRRNIRNDKPIVGPYNVNQEGSGDMYNKGNNLLHTIRQIINNDTLFLKILRGLNKTFYHQTVTSRDIENYMSKTSGKDLSKVFDQYLRTTKIPMLEYKDGDGKMSYRWANTIDGFNMPVYIGKEKKLTLKPTNSWQQIKLPSNFSMTDVDKSFYITVKKVE